MMTVKDIDSLRHFKFERILNDGMSSSKMLWFPHTILALQILWLIA